MLLLVVLLGCGKCAAVSGGDMVSVLLFLEGCGKYAAVSGGMW